MQINIDKIDNLNTSISNMLEEIKGKIAKSHEDIFIYLYLFMQKNIDEIVLIKDLIKTSSYFSSELITQLTTIETTLRNLSPNSNNSSTNTYINQLKPLLPNLKLLINNFRYVLSDPISTSESLNNIVNYKYYNIDVALKELNEDIAKSKIKIEEKEKSFNDFFDELKNTRNTFVHNSENIVDDFNKLKSNLITKSQKEFTKTHEELKILLNLTSMEAHAKSHMEMSEKFKHSSKNWLIILIVFLVISTGISIFLFVFANDFLPNSDVWVNLTLKTLILLPIFSFTLFAMKQMNSYDELYVNSFHIATEIAVINNYIDDLDDKSIIKSDLAYKYFGNKHNTKFKNANNLPVDIIKNISKLSENDLNTLISTLKSIANDNKIKNKELEKNE